MGNLGLIYEIDLPTFWHHKMRMCAQRQTGDLLTPKKGEHINSKSLQSSNSWENLRLRKWIDPAVGILATTKREWRGKRWNRTWLIDPVRMLGA